MATSLLAGNLIRHRAYLTGEVAATEAKLDTLRRDLTTIDAALRLLDSGLNPDSIKGIQRHYQLLGFKQGEMTRLTFSVLRRATEPVSADFVAEQIAAMKQIELTKDIVTHVRLTMVRLAGEGRVVRSGSPRGRLWALPEQEV